MTRPYRFLSTVDKVLTVAAPPEAVTVESDFVVILAAVLCTLICIVGLIAVARCAWLRRGSDASWAQSPVQQSTNKGINKKVIEVIPKFIFDSDKEDNGRGSCGMLNSSDCVICLTEYVTGDEIRVLPLCGHGFHVDCIDMWLSSHSSCPSCRQVFVTSRCKTCEFSTDGNVLLDIENKGRQHSSSSSSSSDYLT